MLWKCQVSPFYLLFAAAAGVKAELALTAALASMSRFISIINQLDYRARKVHSFAGSL